ncbi:hypothetical protein ACTXG7_01340 [Mycolicibacterium sp. Dal123E01]|uniref:hypothetical protein n=1 Tax=Mycolicibacterium sp. Dal123E01 TaxID=3457578 RepID=UPI00403E9EF9
MSGVVRLAVRVSVAGRTGCGRRTVTRVLRGAGVVLAGPGEPADLDVYVLAETLKPEDRRALTGSSRPVVGVLNKVDLTGFGGDGPVATAAARGRRLSELTGVAVYPLAGLAALAAVDDAVVDDEMLEALRTLTTDPADLGSTDRFAAKAHRLSRELRERLLTQLDLFGIAHGVLALRAGADRAGVISALRQVSGLDVLLAGIEEAAAPVHYERLAAGETIAARMAAAVAVVHAAGMTVDDGVTEAAHLRRAITWQRYSRGPVSRLHRSCGIDIARGSLRLWEDAGGAPEELP